MAGAGDDMLRYYHGCLLEKLRMVADYKEVRGKLIADSLTSAVVKLKAAVKVLLGGVPGQGAQDSITAEMMDTLRTNLVRAQEAWKTEAGEVSMHTVLKHTGNGRWESFQEMYAGEDNVVIFEVTQLMKECLTLVGVCVEMAGAGGASGERADKIISVSVAEYDGYFTTFRAATEKIVNGTHTVQACVREAYAAFPQRCLRVKVRRNGEYIDGALWYPGDSMEVWGRELYDAIADGDEVVIVISLYVPGGPRKEEEGVAAKPPWDDGGGRSDRAAGPQRARVVATLLARLATLGGRDVMHLSERRI